MKNFTLTLLTLLTTCFGLLAQCPFPSDLNITNVTATSAVLNWSEVDNQIMYQISIMADNTSEPLAGPTINDGSLSLPSYAPLLPATTYYAYVRAMCQGGVFSSWSAPVGFTTCTANAIPYLLDFESVEVPSIPDCTLAANLSEGGEWATSLNPGSGFTSNTLQFTSNSEAGNAWFFSEAFELEGGNYKISYKYGNNSTDDTGSLRVFLVQNNNASTINTDSPLSNHPSVTGGEVIEYTFNAPIQAAGVFYLAFNAYSTGNTGHIYADDIAVDIYTCGIPQNLEAENFTQNSASISWEAPEENTTMLYLYGFGSIDTPPTELLNTTQTNLDLSELTPGTTYHFYIQSLCGPLMGEWATISFTTPACEAATVPYIQDFESAEVPSIPECTLSAHYGDAGQWITADNPGNGFTSTTLQYTSNGETADTWFYTQGIELEAGVNYKFSYRYGNNSTESNGSIRTFLLNNPYYGWANPEQPFTNHENIADGTAIEFMLDGPFSVPESGIYYIAFNTYGEGETGNIYIDDIKVEEWTCGVPQNAAATAVTENSATITWEEPSDNTTMFYLYGFGTEEIPPSELEQTNDLSIVLNDLEPNTTYYFYVQSLCGPLMGEWTIVTFTTEEESVNNLTENSFRNFTYHPNPVNDILNLNSTANIDQVEIYTLTGQLILKQTGNGNQLKVNISGLTTGVYFLTAYSGNETKKIKVIKQ